MKTRTILIIAVALLFIVGIGLALSMRAGRETPLDAAVVAQIAKVEEAIGLKFKQPPKVANRSRAEVRSFITAQLEDSVTAKELVGQEAVLKRLGLMPEDKSLKQIYLDVLEEQIAGYYDPKTRVLYVVDSVMPQLRELTIAHELIHALQDQYVNLDSIQNIRGQDDRQITAHAIMEGQATLEMLLLTPGAGGLVLGGGWDMMRQMIRDEQSKSPRFSAAPIIIQEMLLFPYLSGAEFVMRYKKNKPDGKLFEDIPASTEQLLHSPAFFPDRDVPTEVVLPPLNAGLTSEYENTMGEFATRVFFYEHRRNSENAVRVAMGWDGDRYVLFRAGQSTGIAWVSVWDSAIEAGEFRAAMANHLESNFFMPRAVRVPPASRPGTIEGTEYQTKDRVFYLGSAEISGRPAVIYVDVPAGSSTAVFDVSALRLAERR